MLSVNENSSIYGGYPEVSGNTIAYDDNGNMTSQIDKGILNINYNYLNVPKEITFDPSYILHTSPNGMYNILTNYTYSADGRKLEKRHDYGFVGGSKQFRTKINYFDGFQYTNDVLSFVPTSEGYYDFVQKKYIYNYTDHLGNVRLSYFRNNTGIEILEENNYYPFGMKHEGYNTFGGNPNYNYKYNGKELQEAGMYDYGARMYMPDIGRWGVVDPLAEKMTRHSPYNYAFNNPIRFIDPDGMQAEDIFKWGNNGQLTKVADSNTDVIYAENQFEKDGKTLKVDAKGVEVGERGYIEANRQEITMSATYTDRQGKSSNTLTTLSFYNNSEKAKEVAEYMYNNGTNEFSNSTYTSSKGGFSVISTLGLPSKTILDPKEYMKNFNINGDHFYPSILTNQDHNHPSNYLPSGYMLKNGEYVPRLSDVEGVRGSLDYHNTVNPDFKNVKFRVYLKGKYMNYNPKNAYYE